jgi:hypothetical protein
MRPATRPGRTGRTGRGGIESRPVSWETYPHILWILLFGRRSASGSSRPQSDSPGRERAAGRTAPDNRDIGSQAGSKSQPGSCAKCMLSIIYALVS